MAVPDPVDHHREYRDCRRDPINIRCHLFQTGKVVPRLLVCRNCKNGTCEARCPNFSDMLRYLQITGEDALFENENDGRRYQCLLHVDPFYPGCRGTPSVGDREQVVGLGLSVRYRIQGAIGNVGLSNGCTDVDCRIVTAAEADVRSSSDLIRTLDSSSSLP